MPGTTPAFRLNDGEEIPAIGIGCWMGYVGGNNEVVEMVEHALKVGYRHIDTAFNYGNEAQVGQAIRNSNIPRHELFVTTKLAGEYHGAVQEGLQKSLDNLGLDYIDLFLMHWPQALTLDGEALQPDENPTFVDTWREMEKLVATGQVKSIGVSNFSVKTLEILLPYASIVPAVNQVEMHPLLPQLELLEYCRKMTILLTAYSPLGKHKPMLVQHPAVVDIVTRRRCSAAQVLLGWIISKGVVAIPKSADKKRIEANLSFVHLSPEEVAALDEIHKAEGMHRSVCGFHGKGGICFGWTYEQLGWPMKEGGVIW
ncbi:unnamed protein product [Somion occarium]|uniref:NADP-dependent oxidoreductase domain-containing protein n=1 Tax=Somion occarium TaxID=3059160 RepID=A0ABP1DJ67_9APHY